MSCLKNGNTVISSYIDLIEKPQRTVSVNTAIDGTEYLTRFGSPTITYEVQAWVNFNGKVLLEAAADSLALITMQVRRGTYTGRIKELGDPEALSYGWFHYTMQIAANSEVTDP